VLQTKSSIPAGLSPLVYAYVVDCAPASPYAHSSSTHRFPDERKPSEATPLRLRVQRHLRSLVWVWVWGWDWIRWHTSPRTRSPSSLHPPFTHCPCPPRSLVCGEPSPHRPRLVVSRSTCPPRSSSPHAHSFVLGTAVINNNKVNRTGSLQSGGVEDQPQYPGLRHSASPSARSFSRSPSPLPHSFTQYPSPPSSLVRDGQTSPHRPRLVVSRSTCPPPPPPPTRTAL